MKKRMFRWIACLVIFSMMFGQMSPIVYAMVNSENTVRGYNPFIEYLVDKKDGRFIIRTLDGVPEKSNDNNQKLLFERENDPETSFTTFRVDGENYIFGNAYGLKSGRASDYYTTSDGLLTVSRWEFDGLEIKQALEIIEDPEHPNVGNVRIRYEVTNQSGTTRSVGNRIMLDTQLGSNDGSSFNVGTETITTETSLTGSDIPDFYRTSDDDFAPNVIGYGFMKGWGQAAPDQVVFAHYNTLSTSKWDVTLDQTLDFTTDNNVYEGADSAVAYYFNESPLANGETRTFETFYGIGDFSNYNSDSTYNVLLNAPDQLTVNSQKDGYNESPMTVTVTVDNTMADSENMTGVIISLIKRDSTFADVPGEDYAIEVPLIEKGAVKTFEFQLEPVNQNQYISEPIKVSVTSDNSAMALSNYDYVLMPNINGAKPKLTIEAVSPDTVYYEGYREFAITGKGFSMLTNKGLWELYLVDQQGNELEIPDDNVSIASDEQLNIIIYEDTFDKSTPAGKYTFKMVHSDFGLIQTPTSKAITFSEDIQYKSRKYGVLYVEKLSDGNDYKYEIGIANSADHLSILKKTKDIILDVVGDVVEFSDAQNNKIYKVKTNQQEAIINSVIKYKDGDVPLEIKKTNGLITMTGDGTLQIIGSNEFWWWSFYSYMADGEDYVVNEVISEDEEEDALFEINPEWVEEAGDDEGKSNVVIDFFNPINAIGSAVNTFYDGFNVEIKSVVLLDEGASFGGSIEVEVPFGAEVPAEEKDEDEELSEEEMEASIFEAMQDLFLTDEELDKKYKDRAKNDARRKTSIKLRALLLSDDGMSAKIKELIEASNATPPQKASIILDMALKSPEILMTMHSLIKGTPDEDDPDRKSVGVSIDVKKVIFGKKYKDDFLYDSVRYIGLEAEGEIKVTLPFGTEEDREEDQGVRAFASINTIEGEYAFEADVDLELVEAHAIVSIVKVGNELKPDHIELSGGFDPGVPITPPVFINQVGGGVKNLQSKKDDEPLTIIMILGLNVMPAMEGEFRAEASKNGFSLAGSFEIEGGMEIFQEAYIALQWVHPIYFDCGATVDLFDIIEGTASLYIGEIKVEGGGYKFYFEGKVKVSITIPKKVWFVGGMEVGSAELGVSTEKIWGSIEVIGVGVGITYVYGKGVSFADGDEAIALDNLTDVRVPENAMYEGEITKADGTTAEGTFIIGSNIKKVGDSDTAFVSSGIEDLNLCVVSNENNTSYDFVVDGQDNALFELKFIGEVPNLTLTGPSLQPIPLMEGVNYMVRTITAEDSPSGQEENYIYISVVNPENGTYTVESDQSLEVGTMYEAKSIPKMTSLDYEVAGSTMTIDFTATNTEDALVSFFLVHEDGSEYAIENNIVADQNHVTVELPTSLPEGIYTLRASIAHPSYGFHDMVTEKTWTVVDTNKPMDVTDVSVINTGNGCLEATWNHGDKGSDIEYFVNVYDQQGVALAGYTELQTDELDLKFGGAYTGTDALGNNINYQMPTNQRYTLGVTPVRTTEHADGSKTIHIGDELVSDPFVKEQPNPPVLYIDYLDEYIFTGEQILFNQNDLDVDFSANQRVDTDVYVDGEYYMRIFDKQQFVLHLELDDGTHNVAFRTINSANDSTNESIDFVTDTEGPTLLIDSPATTVITDTGNIVVEGVAESGAKVYLQGSPLATDGDGQFKTNFVMDLGKMTEKLSIRAVDFSGNETVYNAEIINGTIAPIESIEIVDENIKGYTGSTNKLLVMATDETGKKVEIDNEDLEFSIIKGDTLARISSKGEVTYFDIGKISLMATYALTEDYLLSDAIEVIIETGIDALRILPEVTSLEVGKQLTLSVVGQSKFSETLLDNNNVTYSIEEGSTSVNLVGSTLTAVKAGTVKIKALYEDDQMNATSEMTLRIIKNPNSSETSNTYEEARIIEIIDSVLTGVWKNLIEREKNLEITGVREIREDINTRITMYDVGSLEIPKGTVLFDDVFLTGIIRDSDELINQVKFRINGEVYEFIFKYSGGKLENNIVLKLKYDSQNVTDMSQLGIYVYNEIFARWQYVGGTIEGDELMASLKHLSKYAVLENIEGQGFMDVDDNWAESFIKSLKSLGVVKGTTSGGYNYYAPNQELTRMELATLAVRVYEQLYVTDALVFDTVTFADETTIPEWGKDYSQKAYAYGLVQGSVVDGQRYFNPYGRATRAETMTILSRAIGGVANTHYEFVDEAQIPEWASEHIQCLVELGIVNGYEDGTIKPNNHITRAEIAKLLYYWIDQEVIKGK